MKLFKSSSTYKAFTRSVRKYYKYGTTLNADVVGTPTVSNGVVSGFVIDNITSTGFTVNDANYGKNDKTACWEAKGYIA